VAVVSDADVERQHDVRTVEAYLRTVHASAIAAGVPGRVVISEALPAERRGRYVSRSWPLDELDAAAEACVSASAEGANIYTRVHLIERDLGPYKRGGSNETRWLSHFAGDVDIAGPGHKLDNLPTTLGEAMQLVTATLPASLVVSSGGGIYPHWLVDPVVEVNDDETRRRVSAIGARLDAALASHGRYVDRTCRDLARVIRPPGVTNHKPGRDPRPVKVALGALLGAGVYSLDELDELLPPLPASEVRPRDRSGDRRASSTFTTGSTSAPWQIFAERYSLGDVLGRDPLWQWEQVRDVAGEEAWRRVGSSSDYSLRRHPSTGAVVIWSEVVAHRLGVKSGEALDLYGLALRLAGRDPATAGKSRGVPR
jgi:hypothetical protein